MTKPWSYQATQDKLRMFVSSRLKECREERKAVHEAISSLNHEPVLFEHLGARSYPARDLYLSRLRDSQVMVAIYRSGYGYIDTANGMTISGLEDEFRFAIEHGIDTLFYVAQDAGDRDARLSAMIQEASAHCTLHRYSEAGELTERVRDDLTALITDRFLRADVRRGVLKETSAELLERSLRRNGLVLKREALVSEVVRCWRKAHALCVYGPPGIGKTTLMAQVAESESASFVRVTGLAQKDLFSVCAAAVSLTDEESQNYSTVQAARAGFAAAWAKQDRICLIVDECEYIDDLCDEIERAGGINLNKRLIFTSREATGSCEVFEVPTLTEAEALLIIDASGLPVPANAASGAKGNPLALQEALAEAELLRPSSSASKAAGRELLAYLSLGDMPLSAERLLDLLGYENYSIEDLYADLHGLGRLIDDSPRGFRLIHAETGSELRKELLRTPQRLQFYINRLVRHFKRDGDLRMAYKMALVADDGREERYAVPALRQGAQLGDWRLCLTIADRLLVQALDAKHKTEAFKIMLSLVHPLELMGDAARASELLKTARSLAETIGVSAAAALHEVELSSRARKTLSSTDVAALENLHAHYGKIGRLWDQARIGIELSALYIAAKSFERAVSILKPAVAVFKELGDDYGAETAERNLASSLIELPGKAGEAEHLIRAISARSGEQVDTRRQRAWICNILTRKYRKSDRNDDAEALAKEAIDIGEELGDNALRAINLINLGNVYSDQNRPQDAIDRYNEAAGLAQKCGRRDVEADASRLVASVLNDLADDQPGFSDRNEQARIFAQHADRLLRGTIYQEAHIRALIELGQALQSLHQYAEAATTYFDAARESSQAPDERMMEHSLIAAADLAMPDHVEVYIEGLAHALGVTKVTGDTLSERFIQLVNPILLHTPRGALAHLLGAHLRYLISNLPPLLQKALMGAIIDIVKDASCDESVRESLWRMLHSGLTVAPLLKYDPSPFLHAKLAEIVTAHVCGLDARELGNGERIWTVVLELNRPVTVTIQSIDDAPSTSIATFCLSLFIKAFESDIRDQFVTKPVIDELLVQVGSYASIPDFLRETMDKTVGAGKILANQSCVVTRPTTFRGDTPTPTVVLLAPSFLDNAISGEGGGGSLQILFGVTLVEIVFQLLHGEVHADEIRPKIVSLVRRTM